MEGYTHQIKDVLMSSQFRSKTSVLLANLAISSSLIFTFPVQAQLPTVAQVIYVDPVTGVNTAEAGTSATTPYKTITFALSQTKPGSVIQLAPGNYSSETFPILLKPGITLRGDESSKGRRVVISGGGIYISRTFAKQNITILADQDTTIAGITVTNTNERGTGLWVESSNPIIINNTFTNNFREGVFVTGTGNPRVENNQFVQNSANGIAITKSSRGEIRNNLFQNNGFGLAIGDTSTPLITENQIVQNKDGIVISESAKPLLRKNVIQNNQRDGIVLILNASPDLGTNNNPGSNSISNNGRYNLYNATKNSISAVGNNVDSSRIAGSVEIGNSQRSTPYSSQSDDLSANDPNIALLQKWELTPISCASGSQVITIMMGGKQYCVMPHPDLTANSYEYNQSNGNLKALVNSANRASRPKKGGL
jgi:parallel beta-helix repeat protein